MPLNNLNSHDVLVWKENKVNKFLVRTAYRIALCLKNPSYAEHSSVQRHGTTWGKIWWLNVPPNVWTFLWRACSNCLPTRDNLCKRRVKVTARCEICQQHRETVSHVLWECAFKRNVWSLSNGRTQKCRNDATDFFLLFEQMRMKLDQPELERWETTAWALWNARNRFYFEHVQVHPRLIMDGARGLLDEYQRLTAAQLKLMSRPVV